MTIGDLERRAKLDTSPEGRAAFWKNFAHLEGRQMINAGCTELRRRIGEDEARSPVTDITENAERNAL